MSQPTPAPKPVPPVPKANNTRGLLPELSIRDYKPAEKDLAQIWGPRVDGKPRESS
jgi:hypothetical protein